MLPLLRLSKAEGETDENAEKVAVAVLQAVGATLPVTGPVRELVADTVPLKEGDPDGVVAPDVEGAAVGVAVPLPCAIEGEPEGEPVGVSANPATLGVAELLSPPGPPGEAVDRGALAEGDREGELEGEGLADGLPEASAVREAEADPDSDPAAEAVSCAEAVGEPADGVPVLRPLKLATSAVRVKAAVALDEGVAVLHTVGVRVPAAEIEARADGEAAGERLAVPVPVTVKMPVRVGVAEVDADPESEKGAEAVQDALGVAVAQAPRLGVGACVAEAVVLADCRCGESVGAAVESAVPLLLAHPVAVGEPDSGAEGVPDTEGAALLGLAACDPVPPLLGEETAVEVADTDADPVAVLHSVAIEEVLGEVEMEGAPVGVALMRAETVFAGAEGEARVEGVGPSPDTVALPLPGGDAVALPLPQKVSVGEEVEEGVGVPVPAVPQALLVGTANEGEALPEELASAVPVTAILGVAEAQGQGDGVMESKGEPDADGDEETVREERGELDPVPHGETDVDAEAQRVGSGALPLALLLALPETVAVLQGLAEAELQPDTEAMREAVGMAVTEAVEVCSPVAVFVTDPLPELVRVRSKEPDAEGQVEGEKEPEWVRDTGGLRLALPLREGEALEEPQAVEHSVGEGLADTEGDPEAVRDGTCERLLEAHAVNTAVVEGDGVLEAERPGDREGEGEGLEERVSRGVVDAEAQPLGRCGEGEGEEETVLERDGERVAEGEEETESVGRRVPLVLPQEETLLLKEGEPVP